jgi:hypothetical protein
VVRTEVFADRLQALIQNNVTISPKEEKEVLAEWRAKLGASPNPKL